MNSLMPFLPRETGEKVTLEDVAKTVYLETKTPTFVISSSFRTVVVTQSLPETKSRASLPIHLKNRKRRGGHKVEKIIKKTISTKISYICLDCSIRGKYSKNHRQRQISIQKRLSNITYAEKRA